MDPLRCPCCDGPADPDFLRFLQGREVAPWGEHGTDWLLDRARQGTIRWACQGCIQAGRAILAQPDRQVRWDGAYCPVYVDMTLTCRVCEVSFVHTAKEQQRWYEVYRLRMIWGPGAPHRCLGCRIDKAHARRAMHALQARLRDYDPHSADDLCEIAGLYRAVGADRKSVMFLRRAKNRAAEWRREEILTLLAEWEGTD